MEFWNSTIFVGNRCPLLMYFNAIKENVLLMGVNIFGCVQGPFLIESVGAKTSANTGLMCNRRLSIGTKIKCSKNEYDLRTGGDRGVERRWLLNYGDSLTILVQMISRNLTFIVCTS